MIMRGMNVAGRKISRDAMMFICYAEIMLRLSRRFKIVICGFMCLGSIGSFFIRHMNQIYFHSGSFGHSEIPFDLPKRRKTTCCLQETLPPHLKPI